MFIGTYAVTNTTPNVEGLTFGSARIPHENNGRNFKRVRMYE
jgi:hypothetical protein